MHRTNVQAKAGGLIPQQQNRSPDAGEKGIIRAGRRTAITRIGSWSERLYICARSEFRQAFFHTFIILATLFFVLPGSVPVLQAQVSLAPVMVFIHDDSGVGSLYVSNRSDEVQEVMITTKFGYPGSDDHGNLVMVYEHPEKADQYGLDQRLRIFPRNFILEPHQNQTVRLQVLPDRDISGGVYWTRVQVTSNPLTRNVDEEAAGGVSTRINYRLEQNIAAFYRTDGATTGVEIEEFHFEKNGDKLLIIPGVRRTGNSPFLGTLSGELFNRDGEKVAEASVSTTVYFREKKRMELNVESLPPGDYRMELHFDTRRRDLSQSDLVQAQRFTESFKVEL